ncbi:uncharacterized protein SPSK_00508 [Sporothrix schenckii 1099-18]|uniref:Uncharacterized protein n=1 Tax=Sporothrix schenckii 1099-18 TaxID=1397361 RepID=A0A0F2LQV6_SPOSC|nr:uncharacterized protein SPSK_00508 [Sporothrix schenckii 1099-18]KJR79902.1 hypothetical protein SPSK_00508 [Sporothrix schenckii 1099-18]
MSIVSNIVPPHAAITSVHLLPHHRLQQVYEVKLSDLTTLLVVLPPRPIVRLLRSELNMARSEAAIVRWLQDELVVTQSPEYISSRGPCYPEQCAAESRAPREPRPAAQKSLTAVRSNPAGFPKMVKADLIQYIPCPLSLAPQPHSATSVDSSSFVSPPSSLSSYLSSFSSSSPSLLEFNVFRPPPGTPVAALSSPLTTEERASVDYQAGKFLRRLSQVTSKSGSFGPALAVLTPHSKPGIPQVGDLVTGMSSWSVAFHSILESILRDGEDVAVSLAYSTVRKHFCRLGHLLDSVTTPSLVIVDAMDDTNLLVKRSPAVRRHSSSSYLCPVTDSDPNKTGLKEPKQRNTFPASPTDQEPSSRADVQIGQNSCLQDVPQLSSPESSEPPADIFVTGLRDWSHCIFGDPLFASVFCDHPSPPFLDGFNGASSGGDSALHDSFTSQEESESSAIRVLLYQCYHAIVQIVRGFYRPTRDQTARELAARKRLTEILAKLDTIDIDTKRQFRHRRSSGEISPSKRSKSECAEEGPRG